MYVSSVSKNGDVCASPLFETKETHMDNTHRNISQERAATLDLMHARQVTNPREASPDESERDMWTSHGSMGPPERLNHLKNTCTSRTDLRVHRTATQRKHSQPTLQVGRTDLELSTQGLPRGVFPLVLKATPGVFGSS
jgi:hypothetical protein